MSAMIGKIATGNWKGIFFIILGVCLAGVAAAMTMPSSVFPQTNFPRVTIMIDNGEMPAEEMKADSEQVGNGLRKLDGKWVPVEEWDKTRAEMLRKGMKLWGENGSSGKWVTAEEYDRLAKNREAELTVVAEDIIKPRFLQIK